MKLDDIIAIIGVCSLFIILFTPLIWVWIGFDLFLKTFLTFAIIFIACYIIQKIINEAEKES